MSLVSIIAVSVVALAQAQTVPVVVDGPRKPRAAPSGLTTSANSGAGREIWCATWRPVPEDCGNMSEMIFLPGVFTPGGSNVLPDPVEIAQIAASRPVGRVAMQPMRYAHHLFGATVDPLASGAASPWGQNSVRETALEWTGWLEEYRRAGGKLDLLACDIESWGQFKNWSLNQQRIDEIVADSRASARIHGVAPLRELLGETRLDKVMQPVVQPDYLSWNQAVGTLSAAMIRKAVWAPAKRAFPNLIGSNFHGVTMTDRPAPDLNGHMQPLNTAVGTASAPAAYGENRQASTAWYLDPEVKGALSRTGSERLLKAPWTSFLMDMQLGRACRRSDSSRPMQPWVALPSWEGTPQGSVDYPKDPRCWDEMIRHYALLGTEVYLFWNTSTASMHLDATVGTREECARRLNDLLSEINGKTRGTVVSTIPASAKPLSWTSEVVVTGAVRADGVRVWRVSCHPSVRSIRNVRTGRTIVLESGELGFWSETRSDTPPEFEIVSRHGSDASIATGG